MTDSSAGSWGRGEPRAGSRPSTVSYPFIPRVGDELRRNLPTPVRRLTLSANHVLWLKDDGLTGSFYGGNKLRKLGPLFGALQTRRVERVWTLGAAGSHHVLSTACYAQAEGWPVSAWLLPQPGTPHVVDVLRGLVATGAELIPLRFSPDWRVRVRLRLRAALGANHVWIGPGAIGARASEGYAWAARELAEQVRQGELPEPERLVVAAGTGGTAAGLLAGLIQTPLRTRVVAVAVATRRLSRPLILGQAAAVLRRQGARVDARELLRRLELRLDFLGSGYGHGTQASAEAMALACDLGLQLEHTYTAKAFAAAAKLSKDGTDRRGRVLFWQTLSQRGMEPLLQIAPPLERLPASLSSLLLPQSP